MSRLEKHAWFNLGVFAVACGLYAAVVPFMGVLPGFAVFGLCGLWAVPDFLFYPKGKLSTVLDERELGIMRRAWQAGHGLFWGVFVIGTMWTWEQHRGGSVCLSSELLPLLVMGGFMLVVLGQSIAMLVLSRTGVSHADL